MTTAKTSHLITAFALAVLVSMGITRCVTKPPYGGEIYISPNQSAWCRDRESSRLWQGYGWRCTSSPGQADCVCRQPDGAVGGTTAYRKGGW